MAHKLWDFGRRNGGTGRKNYGILQQDGSPKTMTKALICRNPAIKPGMNLAQIYYYLNKTRRGCY